MPGKAELSSTEATGAQQFPLRTVVFLLCMVSGCLDAIAFLTLGEAFASVMTGNIVFVGLAMGTLNFRLAIYCGTAIVGYGLGVLGGSWFVNSKVRSGGQEPLWPSRVTKTLALQWALLAIASGAWLVLRGRPDDIVEFLMLMAVTCALGIQSAAVRAVRVPVSTTYMTGAFTTLLEALATRRPFSHTEASALGGLIALALGAAWGGFMILRFTPFALLVPTAILAVVVVIGAVKHLRHRRGTGGIEAAHQLLE
jgi:uncharacterized membrane protein YoaK (UPF0700 family)